ncbi:MAG: hypothetical protein IPL78_09370 [Chloroflexi bacterium]|nr:hypothetical protein [Chloroflexota bacterium]
MLTKDKVPVLPSVWDTLKAGLDLTTKHLWLIIIPVLLDSFYWLGPRVSIRPLLEAFLSLMVQQAAATNQPAATIQTLNSMAEQWASAVNLLTTITIPLIGVPALMSGLTPEKTPISSSIIEIDNLGGVVLLFTLFLGVGLVLSAIYYGLIAQAVRAESARLDWWWREWPRALFKLIALVFLVLTMGLMASFPFFCLSMFAALFSINLATLIWFVGAMPLMALILYGFFAPHGVLLQARPVLAAWRESLGLMRQHLAPALGLLLVIYLVGNGLTILWQIADDGSWLTLVSIVGHGFVSTALAAATFIFYRDRYATLPEPPPSPQT